MQLHEDAWAEFRNQVIARANHLLASKPELAHSLLFLGGQLERLGVASDDRIAALGDFLEPALAQETRILLRQIRDHVTALSN